MKEIVNRLNERRQVELAKQIMESAGYEVTANSSKKLNESAIPGERVSASDYIELIRYSDEGEPEVFERVISTIEKYPEAVVYTDVGTLDYEVIKDIVDDGYNYFALCYVTLEDGANKFKAYCFWNKTGMMDVIVPNPIALPESKKFEESKNLNESAIDKFWDLYDSDDAVADNLTKIANDLGIDDDAELSERDAQRILDVYAGDDSVDVIDNNKVITEIMYAIEDIPFVEGVQTFEDRGLMTRNKGFVVTDKNGNEYQFSLLGSF